MPRILLIPAVIAVLLATALPAFAQSAPVETTSDVPAATTATPAAAPSTAKPDAEIFGDNLERWNRVLERVEERLEAEDLSLAVLGDLEATVDGVREQVGLARGPVQKEADRVGVLLRALGTPPQEGEEPETDNLAAQRRDLNRE
jgi:small-conductance mechanosensitive channel